MVLALRRDGLATTLNGLKSGGRVPPFFSRARVRSISRGLEEVIVLGSFVPLGQESSNPASLLLFLGLMAVVFYFLMIRPQQRRMRAQRDLMKSLEVGDEVQTIGGMFGTIRSLDDDSVTVEVSPGIEIRFVRGAIARKLVVEDELQDAEDEALEEEEAEEPGGEK
jgi:preprotein translocase subunit YajC